MSLKVQKLGGCLFEINKKKLAVEKIKLLARGMEGGCVYAANRSPQPF